MENFKKLAKFDVRSVIEQKPFKNPAVQYFFEKWFKVNDFIELQVISREKWIEYKEKGILEAKPDGKKLLFIPDDLQLWEIIGIIEAIDRDTFKNNPEKVKEAKEKLLELGKIFKNAGIYIAQRLNNIQEGREIAEALALEFYQYGQLLSQEETQEELKIEDISSHQLTLKETEEVDFFLAGKTLYESRKQRIDKEIQKNQTINKEKLYEEQRQKTLAQFFRAAEKAFIIKYKTEKGGLKEIQSELKPWQTPIHDDFLRRIEKALSRKIEAPKQELIASIFRHGMELLKNSMLFDKLPDYVKDYIIYWQNGERTLREAIKIDELKKELAAMRKNNVDPEEIAKKELKIAEKIQLVISSFPQEKGSDKPLGIIVTQAINCVGASLLGGALFEEVGLKYLVVSVPGHSVLFLITSNGQVWWFDMLNAEANKILTDDMIEGKRKDGKSLTVKDIIDFSQDIGSEELIFDLKLPSELYKELLPEIIDQYIKINIFKPERGHQIQVLFNLGLALFELNRYEEAIEVYKQVIALSPKYANAYNNLGFFLSEFSLREEAIEAYKQAITLNPKYATAYNNLGNALFELNRYEEAIEAYKQAIAINPNFTEAYNNLGNALFKLNRYEEAIEAFENFIKLADREKYKSLIKDVIKLIVQLREQLKK
ncbi:MAG: hypothetical protein KatS3mg096_438 [Candidatus Parcubacteria bacterium]|nr:MAG: hypothetical protein KatS3mg096_438 [Candidatus Parcubacteria bacterium]